MNLNFDFTVDKATKTIHITREFAADLDLVWDAFTKAEMLEKWTAPKPYRIQTKEMDFREGGRWLYTMVSQENPTPSRYSLVEYLKIQPKTSFTSKNTFADENGNSAGSAFSMVKNTFKAGPEITTFYMEKVFDDLATVEMFAKNGFKEGCEEGYKTLDEYLRAVVAKLQK